MALMLLNLNSLPADITTVWATHVPELAAQWARNVTEPGPVCEDKEPKCKDWAAAGECERNPGDWPRRLCHTRGPSACILLVPCQLSALVLMPSKHHVLLGLGPSPCSQVAPSIAGHQMVHLSRSCRCE